MKKHIIKLLWIILLSSTFSINALASFDTWVDQWYGKTVPVASQIPGIEVDGTSYSIPTNWHLEDFDPGTVRLSGGDNAMLTIGDWRTTNAVVDLTIWTPQNQTITFNFTGDSYDNLQLVKAEKIQWGINSDRTPMPVSHNLPTNLNFTNWLANPQETYQWLVLGGYRMPYLPNFLYTINTESIAKELSKELMFIDGQWVVYQY
jgi:hypothetical protein